MQLPWVEKYKPKKLEDLAIIKRLRDRFKKIIEDQDVKKHILFYGEPGHGKTSLSDLLVKLIKTDCMIVNGSDDNGVDYVRGPVTKFMGTAPSGKNRKILFYDECDRLNAGGHAAANALKVKLEKYQFNCAMIGATNYIDQFQKPFLDRFELISLLPDNEAEIKELKKEFYLRSLEILDKEGVEYRVEMRGKNKDIRIAPDVLALITGNKDEGFKGLYPRFRSIVNALQSAYETDGEISEKMLSRNYGQNKLFDALRQNKPINTLIELCNSVDPNHFFDNFTNNVLEYVEEESITDAFEAVFFYNTKGKMAISETANLASAIVELRNKKLKFKIA